MSRRAPRRTKRERQQEANEKRATWRAGVPLLLSGERKPLVDADRAVLALARLFPGRDEGAYADGAIAACMIGPVTQSKMTGEEVVEQFLALSQNEVGRVALDAIPQPYRGMLRAVIEPPENG